MHALLVLEVSQNVYKKLWAHAVLSFDSSMLEQVVTYVNESIPTPDNRMIVHTTKRQMDHLLSRVTPIDIMPGDDVANTIQFVFNEHKAGRAKNALQPMYEGEDVYVQIDTKINR